jgi:hypothetical protein
MRRVVSLLVLLAACGGTQIPMHNGYKSEKLKPWKSAKALTFDDKKEAKAEGSLSYPDMKRAHWYSVDLPSNGVLGVKLEITPPGDAVNDDFDLAMEILDPGNRVIIKADAEEADAHDLTKKRDLPDLPAGKYLIHLYLQGRLDTADFILHATFKPTAAAAIKSDFPEKVAFVPTNLPMVPLQDDTPAKYRPPVTVVTHIPPGKHPKPPDKPVVVTPPPASMKARIIGVAVGTGGTQITVGRGTESGASQGMHGHIAGVPGTFTLSVCSPRTCIATVAATPDQIKGAGGDVELVP